MSSGTPALLRASKIPGYLIEPLACGDYGSWEDHHATNPCAIRLSSDPRVFLGYRAGGSDDYFRYAQHDVYGSHLGMAILDETGTSVRHRFPLPIFTPLDKVALPRTLEEYEAYQAGPDRDRIVVMHDFRLWEDRGFLYLLYHEGSISTVYDCICRMRVQDFIRRIDQSIELLGRPSAELRSSWKDIWYGSEIWEPAGVNGTNRTYASTMSKNDIVFLRLADGTLRMYHRPVPDIAVLNTGQNTFSHAEPDGITAIGCLQQCIRPGFTDNSHIGPNAAPIPVRIGEVLVYMDVVHGVYNDRIANPDGDPDEKWKLIYLPYLRLLDYETGECLYYSDEPLLDADDVWREYVEQGTWVSKIKHLDAVMFTGGQLEKTQGRNGLDDVFCAYTGVGDTAVARAEFRLRDVLPADVIEDIIARPAHRRARVEVFDAPTFEFPELLAGWEWSIDSDCVSRCLQIHRRLDTEGRSESCIRPVTGRPGYFDADGVFYPGGVIRRIDDLGWIVVYRGIRWEECDGLKVTVTGLGLLLLDRDNPERILYRSATAISGTVTLQSGWTDGSGCSGLRRTLEEAERHIPDKVLAEVRRIYEMKPMPSDMTRWLKRKAGLPES